MLLPLLRAGPNLLMPGDAIASSHSLPSSPNLAMPWPARAPTSSSSARSPPRRWRWPSWAYSWPSAPPSASRSGSTPGSSAPSSPSAAATAPGPSSPAPLMASAAAARGLLPRASSPHAGSLLPPSMAGAGGARARDAAVFAAGVAAAATVLALWSSASILECGGRARAWEAGRDDRSEGPRDGGSAPAPGGGAPGGGRTRGRGRRASRAQRALLRARERRVA